MYCPGITTYPPPSLSEYPCIVHVLSRDYHLPPTPLVRVSVYARVTLSVHVLSRDYYLPPTLLVRVSVYARVTLAVHVLSRDYYLPPTLLVRVSVYARVTLAVHVLFNTSNKLRDLGRNTPMWYNYHGWRTFWRRI